MPLWRTRHDLEFLTKQAVAIALLWGASTLHLQAAAPAPVWRTYSTNPTSQYRQMAYPIAFVASPIVETTVPTCRVVNGSNVSCTPNPPPPPTCPGGTMVNAKYGSYKIGTDVLSASAPSVGNELWIYTPQNGNVVKLFPLPNHYASRQIDFPETYGSVLEPNLSEDGKRIYFSYVQDATAVTNQGRIPLSGTDIYWIDVGPMLLSSPPPPSSLVVKRLTTRTYTPSGSSTQNATDRDKDAMNITMAAQTSFGETQYGVAYLHPTEVRTRTGLKLAYVTDKRRLDNSNFPQSRDNHNFNLHLADLLPDGSLGPVDNQFQYYTTTSVLSPAPLREGLAISYQATTEDARNWEIQGLDSEGRWYPLLGYGVSPMLFHLQSFCVANPLDSSGAPLPRADFLVAAHYYNGSNEAFGALWRQNLATVGKNSYSTQSANGIYIPNQVGSLQLTADWQDDPSGKNAAGQYIGKLSTPRCGGANELYFAYTPTSANARLLDPECNRSSYRAYIGFRPNLEPWSPDVVGSSGHQIVVQDISNSVTLNWPVPIVPWSVRSDGDTQQRASASPVVVNQSYITPGLPYAQVGTSALWNTDRRPFECAFVGQNQQNPTYYTPWGVSNVNRENDLIAGNQDGLTIIPSNGLCAQLPRERILGIAVGLTSNNTSLRDINPGHETVGNGSVGSRPVEAKKLLGVYDVRGQADQSFRALIPANVPFDFQLLDSTYGLKLTDVRSWHSLKARERRVNCGGCHQHDVNAAPVPFEGTVASYTAPRDFVNQTTQVAYNSNCQPIITTTTNPSERLPEWRSDIWQGMQTYCSSCHTTGGSGAAALSWSATSPDERQVYRDIADRRFASPQRGALGSQLFWAARGMRTDNRSNSAYVPQYSNTSLQGGARWGFYYSAAHNVNAQTCTTGNASYAAWLLKLGQWIDNHMPRDTDYGVANGTGYSRDWYHPTIDVAINSPTCAATQLRVGWWDDSNQSKAVIVKLNGTVLSPTVSLPPTPFANGSRLYNLSGSISNSDVVSVEAIDNVDNRQIYRKRIDVLRDECLLPVVIDPAPPEP